MGIQNTNNYGQNPDLWIRILATDYEAEEEEIEMN